MASPRESVVLSGLTGSALFFHGYIALLIPDLVKDRSDAPLEAVDR